MMKKTIMVVDDEKDIRKTIRAILEKNGFNVVTAVNADDCQRKLTKIKPDLILLDIMMPGTPVRKFVKKIKNTKIAYLTVVRMSEAEKEDLLLQKNIVDYIEKPFEMKNFIRRIKMIVSL
jgi:DNA-binding response OmpR family regulator